MLYDLLVIGDEREGVGRAIAAARLGRRVAVISDPETSPSLKLLMDAVENLSINGRLAAAEGRDPSFARRAILVSSRLAKLRVSTMTAWRTEVERLWQRQISADHSQMDSLAIDRISGNAEFVSQMSVRITGCCSPQVVSGTEIVIACGTKSLKPASFHCDGRRVLVVESLLQLTSVPKSTIVVGAGETGFAAAVLLARLGSEVTVIDDHDSLFEICRMFGDSFDMIHELPIAFRLGEEAIGVEKRSENQAIVRLGSGREMTAEVILACVGREGRTETMKLESAGVGFDERNRVWCDDRGQTWSPRIVAVGSVVGFSGVADRLSILERGNPKPVAWASTRAKQHP